jgi:osmotically-inducible protein OsmY
VNEISAEPVGSESKAADTASKMDDVIEKNYKAALIPTDLNYEHIKYKSTNGVLTLTGRVHNPAQRQFAENLAAKIPVVQQVLN